MIDLLYRKKPVVIEAMQFQPVGSSGEDAARVESWCGGEMVVDDQGYGLVIKTLEGRMRASPGDWIIKGVAGEFYPCKPDIFEKTYESATLTAVQPVTEITADMVNTLREKTGAGMLDAKRALAECLGDMDEAVEWLRYKGTSRPYIPKHKRLPAVQPAHVNETAKSEHDAAVMLTPATKGANDD